MLKYTLGEEPTEIVMICIHTTTDDRGRFGDLIDRFVAFPAAEKMGAWARRCGWCTLVSEDFPTLKRDGIIGEPQYALYGEPVRLPLPSSAHA
jgi:hypothetical protein